MLKMTDYLVRSLAAGKELRAYAIDATEIVREMQKRQDTWSAASAALGRATVGSLLLAATTLKGDGRLTVKIDGGGPVGGVVVDADAHGHVKGYVQHPHVHLPLNENGKIDVRGAVGTDGFLAVTKDLGLKEAFTGQVPLVSGELGEDFTYYLAKSEQIPSAVGLSVFVNADNTIEVAGGFMIQVLPGASEETIASLETKLKDMPLVSQMMREGMKPEDILNWLFGEDDVDILARDTVKFECDCSKDRFAQALASIAPADLEKMITEDHGAQAVCHFCGNKYEFSEDELREISVQAQAK
ncbi:chaperonin HslO [Ligilactobacillus equi DPC 6820]|uniref:33 kDa chaperonin n=2 Tax=Ligilactobacillus equi TaxID=137357 RepID=V7HY56_9LACO|nr:chaperonin HslO [Ligilactobacillus equi DPC 6820]